MRRHEDFESHDEADGFEDWRDLASNGGAADVPGEADRSGAVPSGSGSGRASRGLAERLRGILGDEGDGDPVFERGDADGGMMQWIRALDLQVLGACRDDERLKPLLKLNLSIGAAEDHLMAQLGQHFEVSEVGMLIRCLCVPLVSMRAGKVSKQGNTLVPTNIRGHLNITLSPSSDIHIIFCGDVGCNERLATISHGSESSNVLVEEISADSSGRSFLLKLPGDQVSYFWCSEKSKLLGVELLKKMRNLFQRKPSLSQLSGICESRLDSFATHLRAYLIGVPNSNENSASSSCSSLVSTGSIQASEMSSQSFCTNFESSRAHLSSSQSVKLQPIYQGSLSPRSNPFKDGFSRSLPSLRNGIREKFKRQMETCSLLVADSAAASTSTLPDVCPHLCRSQIGTVKLELQNSLNNLSLSLPEPISASLSSSIDSLSFPLPFSQLPTPSPSLFTPYYCWCPPPSSFQHMLSPASLPSLASESLPLPPLSSLLSSSGSVSLLPTKLPCEHNQLTALDLPVFLPVSPFVSMPISQQIPTFTPFISDPIVHIPVIDVCSSGPGYLVSAGLAIPSAIPSLLPNLVSPLTPETESVVEKNARETLRLLMASAPSSTQLMKVFPTVLTSVDQNIPYIHGKKQVAVVTGGRGLYTGAQNVDNVISGIRWMDLKPPLSGLAISKDNIEEGTSNIWNDEGCETKKNCTEDEKNERTEQ